MDITKGIGIILVILGHTEYPYRDLIYTFHMPLFYIVTGYLFDFSKWENDMKGFIKNRFFKLIVPYLYSCVFFYFIWLVIGHKFGDASARNIPWFIPMIWILYGNGINDYLIFNISL